MKKLSVLLLAVVLSVMFVACGDSKDSKDLNESQTLDSNDSQGESSDLSQDSIQSNTQSSESNADLDSNKSTDESNNESAQNSRTFTEALSDEDAQTGLDEIKEYMSFIVSPQGFNALDALTYDSAKVQVDENNGLEFIDLCKHRVVAGVKYQSVFEGETYDSNCIVSDTHSEGELDGLRKYFIKAKSIDEAFGLYYKTKDKAPKGNVYTYCCDEGLKEDGVGSWFIWNNGRLWIKGSGYDGGDATIFTQKGDFVEVIYRWTIAG